MCLPDYIFPAREEIQHYVHLMKRCGITRGSYGKNSAVCFARFSPNNFCNVTSLPPDIHVKRTLSVGPDFFPIKNVTSIIFDILFT